jgi:class 3 adenylate cyclase/tetratricopeptide (TPR) repeat protein
VEQIADWLNKLGLGQYAQCFAENGIDFSVLGHLTDQDLKDLGVVLGHRRKLLHAIAAFSSDAPITQAPAEQEGVRSHYAERRQLTVMFCDLVGSTALSVRLDPEDVQEIISGYQRRCAEVIGGCGGFVARYMGDGVLAYFGYPNAHEDDVERAGRAALALIEGPASSASSGGGALQMRIGIATGLVVVGQLVHEGAAQEHEVVGEAPNLAARLQGLAEPSTIVIDGNTRRLLGELFEYRALGTVPVKGFDAPMPVWELTGAGTVDSRFEALRAITTPLVGRQEEIDLLMRRWKQAKMGEGSVVLISGEPGIGKSRIAQTLLERLSGEPHTRLRYFCSPHHQSSPLYPTITQLKRAADFHRDDTVDQRLDKLEAVLAQATNDLSRAAPLLAELLSIPTSGRYPPLNFSPQKFKEETLRAKVAQVEGLASRQPVLMVSEDAHWSDPTSLELLDLIIDRVPALSILVIVTFRPEFTAPWIGRPNVTLLTLNRLSPRQRGEMITSLTGGKTLPNEIAEQIIDRTDGVPLFIEELTKAVVESGVLVDAGDRYLPAGQLPQLAIPKSLNASLVARLDRLAPVREVAQIGAALGRQFSHELISAVAPMSQQQLDDALAQLVSAELIFRRGDPPDAEYTFKHALVQDAAYGIMLRSRRQQLHGRIATILERQFLEIVETQPELLAHHCAEASLIEKAVGYWLRAGQQAIAQWAMTEAVARLRKGLDLLSAMPNGALRQKQELNLQINLGRALMATKGNSATEPGEAFARAHRLYDQLDRPDQVRPRAILLGQFVVSIVRGELEQAGQHAEGMRQLGEAQNDAFWKWAGAGTSGIVCFLRGKFADALNYCESALSFWDPAFRQYSASPEDPHVAILLYLSRILLCLGYVDQAKLKRYEALDEARQRSPFTLAFALWHAWNEDWAIDGVKSVKAMLSASEEVLAIAREQSFALYVGVGNIMRGWCLSASGQTADGIPLLLQGIDIRRSASGMLGVPFALTTLAEVYGMAGQPATGLDRLTDAVELVGKTKERWAEAETHRIRGTLLLSIHENAVAEDSYRYALAVAHRQSAKFWELRAAIALARLLRDQGKRIEARDLLGPIYEWFTEGLNTPSLQDAKALLDQLV